MPDSRHLVMAIDTSDTTHIFHLWLSDTETGSLTQLTTGTAEEMAPVVAPDGNSLLFNQGYGPIDVTSISLQSGETKTLVTTGRMETMPAWSATSPELTWISNRNGPYEVWVRQPDGSERPIVTAAEFPPGTNRWFVTPSLSPDGGRVIYERVDMSMVDRLWMSSVAGGKPVRLTNAEPSGEFSGSWSPDGTRFVYLQRDAGKLSLMTIRAIGNARPVLLRDNVIEAVPEWSPDGNWITFRDSKGWNLISPDGKNMKSLGNVATEYLAFARDGKLLYGIRSIMGGGDAVHNGGAIRVELFSLDPGTLKMATIRELGQDFEPVSPRLCRNSPEHCPRRQDCGLLHRQVPLRSVDAARLPPAQFLEPDHPCPHPESELIKTM